MKYISWHYDKNKIYKKEIPNYFNNSYYVNLEIIEN